MDAALALPEVGVLPDVAWAAVMAQQRDVARFFQSLTREKRRDALLLPAQELDRSMARSKDWDILVTAELDYDYGGGKNALVSYDSGRDSFLPGMALCADGTKGAQLMLASLDPATTARVEAALWRDPGGGHALSPQEAEARSGKALTSYGRRSLELHFTRLFAVRLLARYAEAAREAAAQAALESLLREEESEAAKTREKEAKKKKKAKKKVEKALAKASEMLRCDTHMVFHLLRSHSCSSRAPPSGQDARLFFSECRLPRTRTERTRDPGKSRCAFTAPSAVYSPRTPDSKASPKRD